MRTLAIETSSVRGSLALFEEGACRREVLFPEGLIHGREITVRLEELLRLEGLEARSLEAIAVSVGPGSYTGIRVGVTAAKTLAYCLRIPVVSESSLRVIAANAASGDPLRVVAALDGRQGFLFWAAFSAARGSTGEIAVGRLTPDAASEPGTLAGALGVLPERGAPALVAGDGADALLASAPPGRFARGLREWDVPRARALGELTAEAARAARFDLDAVHGLEPVYLRVTEAERRLAMKGTP
ncbi:MAG: tRNA (adenosine(37)-N6)-threonylcarbamoyltransferase complex dimerization subunit type 1 TsaB [Planctomycetes bacterium]|nr:tRNA (adenosine(37)-N6)-threonylcarbamoyltransferase complex dimerization subunit type 1 TsaB [Planctomycetota bacterium]